MKHTRNAYHYAVRRIKRNVDSIKQMNMANSLINGKVPNLIKELKSQRLGYTCAKATKIDGKFGCDNIANHFSEKYSELYNRNNSSVDLGVVLDSLNLNVNSMADIECVSPQLVYQAICKLNLYKSDNNFN